jgi:uncharacterized protein YndB with AHSA1/START domain
MSSDQKLTVHTTHRFAAKRERVFDAWLDAKTAGKWLFATPTGTITRCEIDPRVGGKFSIVREDGMEIDHVGEYIEIDRPRRLVFTFGVPKFSSETTCVVVEIVANGEGSELTLTHEGVLPDYGERTKEGWAGILGNLEKSIA